jgi:hypothetical protein
VPDTNSNSRKPADPGYHCASDPPGSADQPRLSQQPPSEHPLPGQLLLEEEPGDWEPYDDSPTQAIHVVPPAGLAHAAEPAPKQTPSSEPVAIAHPVTVILASIRVRGLSGDSLGHHQHDRLGSWRWLSPRSAWCSREAG